MSDSLTVRLLEQQMLHELGDLAYPMEFRSYVNMAGNHLVSMYAWSWLQGRTVRIRPRPSVSLTGATWTEATKTLTKVGAFTDYSFLSGDTVEDLGGTGVTALSAEVASRTSNDAIVLVTSIGAGADGQTNIVGTLPNDQVSIAPGFDVQAITGYQMSPGLTRYIQTTTPQELLDLRSWEIGVSSFGFWAMLNYVLSISGGQPAMRLDLWPSQADDELEIVLFVRAGWIEPADDDDTLTIPGHMNMLFTEVLKAVVKGFEEPELGTVDQRLSALRGGVIYMDAIGRDTRAQPDLGPMRGGWMSNLGNDWPRFRNPADGISTYP